MAESYARVAFRCTASNGDPYQTGFALRLLNELGDSTLQEVADAVDTALTTAFRALMYTGEILTDIHVRSLPAGGAIPEQYSKTKNLAGTRTASNSSEPRGLVPVISLNTTAAIRSGRGWMFLPNIIDSSVISSGLLQTSGAYWTAIATFGDALLGLSGDNAGPGTVQVAVYSATRRSRGFSPFIFDVTSYTRRQKVHWLRSRSNLAES